MLTNNNSFFPKINESRAVTKNELEQLEQLALPSYVKPEKQVHKPQILNDSEIEDLRLITSMPPQTEKHLLTQDNIEQILKTANENFYKITGNDDPNKQILYIYDNYTASHQFYNRDSKFCLKLQIRPRQDINEPLRCIADFSDTMSLLNNRGELRMEGLELGTYWRAMRGKDYSAIALGGSTIDAISKTLGTNKITVSGFSRYGQLAVAASGIALESVDKVILRAPLGIRQKQEINIAAYRNLLNPNLQYSSIESQATLKAKTVSVKVPVDHLAGPAPLAGFKSMEKMSDRVVTMPGMAMHVAIDYSVQSFIRRHDRKKEKTHEDKNIIRTCF